MSTNQQNGRNGLPAKAVKLSQRLLQLEKESERGRHIIELMITRHGRWLIVVDDGRIEDLGQD